MRQRKLMKYLRDFDFEMKYHHRKENLVNDALSIRALHTSKWLMNQCKLYEAFRDLNLNVTYLKGGIMLINLDISCNLRSRIAQSNRWIWTNAKEWDNPNFQWN